MVSFWDYLAVILAGVDLGTLTYIGSIILAVGALFGGIVALFFGCERVSARWSGWANVVYVPLVVITAAAIVIFGSWLGIEVSPHV